MIERVALGQSRFMTPGVAPDPRGVLLGRYGVLLFATLEGVVSWFRLYSAEASLDELLAELELHQVRTPLGGREMLLRIPAASSYTLDRAARCAKLVGGSTYTGTSKHFVRYRDDRSPYGYDAVEIHALPKGADLMVHGQGFTQTYTREGQLPFERLLFRLSLRRVPGGMELDDDERDTLVLVVARGLGDGVMRYLWRNQVDAEVGLVRPRGESAFGDAATTDGYLLLRVRALPTRILDLFVATPGIDVFRWVAPQVAVQVGFEHPIDLGSCASVFADEQVFLFWGESARGVRVDRVDVVDGPLELSGIEHFTEVRIAGQDPKRPAALDTRELGEVGVRIRLTPSLTPPRHVIATLIPLRQRHLLKRLVYFLPHSSLREHRVVMTDRGILLVCREDVDVIPLGQLLCELAPGLLVPLGMDLVPRVAPAVLANLLGHGAGQFTVLPHHDPPFQIAESALEPLERRTLAAVEVIPAEVVDARVDLGPEPTVVNDPVGSFALWGFSSPPSRS
ncbi:hypothetical protein [Haliangium sp.]|uniref:hypothetical protein n=1 Tax=Haliangium sp. TaxID=2663208 RepID=UPI003D0AA117